MTQHLDRARRGTTAEDAIDFALNHLSEPFDRLLFLYAWHGGCENILDRYADFPAALRQQQESNANEEHDDRKR